MASVSDNGVGGTLQLWRINDMIWRPEDEVLAEMEEHRCLFPHTSPALAVHLHHAATCERRPLLCAAFSMCAGLAYCCAAICRAHMCNSLQGKRVAA